MANRIKIDGLDDVLRSFDNAPGNMMKASRSAVRAGARAVAKDIRNKTPDRWSGLTDFRVGKSLHGETYATIGLYNVEGRPESEIPDWFKAYWANYGTLENRDPRHRFKNPVKNRTTAAAKARKSTMGQPHQNFFEGAIAGWENTFVEAFEKSIEKQKRKIFK